MGQVQIFEIHKYGPLALIFLSLTSAEVHMATEGFFSFDCPGPAIYLFIDELAGVLEHLHLQTKSIIYGALGSRARGAKVAAGIAPLHVDQLVDGYGDAERVNYRIE